jgi:hypothetical protein
MTFYTFSPGDIAESAKFNSNWNKPFKLTNEQAIADVTSTASGVLAGSSQVLIDKFLDSNGQNNTVDTTSTSGTFNTNKYECNQYIVPNPVGEPGFETVTGWTYSETNGNFAGAQDSTTKTEGTYSYKLSCASNPGGGGVYGQITRDVDFTNISTLHFDETYSSPGGSGIKARVYIGATLVRDQDTSGGLSWTTRTLDVSTYTGTLALIFRYYYSDNYAHNGTWNIDNIKCVGDDYYDSIVQSAVATIPTGMTKVFVTPLMYEALSGSDNITADVSIDNGAHYTTGVPINTWTPITSANGTQLIVKANLLTGDGSTTPKVLGWRVLME